MAAMRSTSRDANLRRALLALLLVLASGLDLVAPHDAMSERSGAPVGVEVEEAARHPGDPLHVEASETEYHPACAACLVQIQTGSVLALLALAAPAFFPTGEVAGLAESPAFFRALPLVPARAPPASPTFV
jgi:hypothetical protein